MLMVMVANFVLVFVYSTQAARDLWWSKLMQESQEEVQKEPPTTNVQVSYQDLIASIEYVSVLLQCVLVTNTNRSAGLVCSYAHLRALGKIFR